MLTGKQNGQDRHGTESYKRIQAEVQRSTRRAHSGYMEDVVSKDLKENSKRFWSHIKSKEEASDVSALLNDDEFLQCDTMIKAEILNKQFVRLHS